MIEALQKNLLLWVDNYQNLVIDSEQKLADKEQELINHNTQEEIMRKIIADKDTHIANQEKVISDITSSLAYRILNKLLHPLGKKHEQ